MAVSYEDTDREKKWGVKESLTMKGLKKRINKLLSWTVCMVAARADVASLLLVFAVKMWLFYRLVGMGVSASAFIISLLAVASLLLCGNLLPAAWRFPFLIIADGGLSLVLFVDTLYHSYFHDVTSVSLLRQIGQVGDIGDSIVSLTNWTCAVYFLDIPLLIVVYRWKMKRVILTYQTRVTKTARRIAALSIPALLVVGTTVHVERTVAQVPGFLDARYSNKALLQALGIYHYHLYDMYQYSKLSLGGKEASSSELEEVRQWFWEHNSKLPPGPLFGRAKGQNVIVVQEESLQAFVVDLKVNGQEVTPHLNQLMREGLAFPHYYDQTHHGRTSDGEFNSLVSLYPSSIAGSIYFNFAENEFDSMPKVLKQHGYATVSAHAYTGAFWNRAVMHRNLGFEQSFFMEDLKPGESFGWGLTDEAFFEQMNEKMEALPKPFFAFLISLSNHHPFEVPPEYKQLDLGELEGTFMGNYLHSSHYADQALGHLIRLLKQNGLYDSSILVVYGDHDAGVPEEELRKIGIVPKYERQYDKVPMVIYSSALADLNGTVQEQVSGHLDLTPTLLYLLGIPQEGHYFMGQRLFDFPDDQRLVVFRDGSYVTQTSAFITRDGLFESGKYYERDSGEPLTVEAAKERFLTAQERLKLSDLMLEGDLFSVLQRMSDERR
ncbi:LTA synthase family protein [Brevibacillus humidisoli]|uniref:LTA synthase family protein n=1 Tax=Brevibacillus humidisoli TaxID=2895522 RepID=UPI001E40A2BB|nr:LTA synthase family protein [Brevibacillus humidisoli]UFJ40746.1 LTA synthase family protein [Brevibacillus humidisoli]